MNPSPSFSPWPPPHVVDRGAISFETLKYNAPLQDFRVLECKIKDSASEWKMVGWKEHGRLDAQVNRVWTRPADTLQLTTTTNGSDLLKLVIDLLAGDLRATTCKVEGS